MKELRVRAWYKITEEMAEVNKIDFVNKTVTIDWADVGYDEDGTDFPINDLTVDFEDVDLLLYPGLHDKTGKEVCEGDIVNFKRYEGVKYEIGEVQIKPEFLLIHCHYGNNPKADYYGMEWTQVNNVEVIGNKYEDKDLLK